MPQNEVISLHESVPPDAGEQVSQETEQDALSVDQGNSRQWESNWKRACVLVGSAILQLPIWGKINSSI
jgi:hypothetical protein